MTSLSLVSDRPFNPDRFLSWIGDVTQRFGVDILRTKGVVAMKNDDDRFVIQAVHMLMEGGRQRPWKQGERRESRLSLLDAIYRETFFAKVSKRAKPECAHTGPVVRR